jgi:hypothetical protein
MEPRDLFIQAPWCERSLLRSVLSRKLSQELDLWLKTMVARDLSDDHIRDELLSRTGIDIKASTIGGWRRQLGYLRREVGPRVKAVDRSQPQDRSHG